MVALGAPYSDLKELVQSCEKKSDTNPNGSIVMTDLGVTPKDYQFTVKGEGTSVFTITCTNPYYPALGEATITNDVTITVAKMNP